MTVIAERPEAVTLHEHGLTIETDLGFNEWRELGRQLIGTTDRALWSLGDWWNYGATKFAKDYHAALRELEAESRLVQIGARVARGFPTERRRGQLTFEIHAVVAGQDEADQERWLDEAERQGWNREQLAFAFGEAVEHVPIAAIGVRATGELHGMLMREAERRDMDPKALGPLALERGLREMARETIEEAA
jgi:hypothetical protein